MNAVVKHVPHVEETTPNAQQYRAFIHQRMPWMFSPAGIRTLFAAGVTLDEVPLYNEYNLDELVDEYNVPDCRSPDLAGVLDYLTDRTTVLYCGNYRWLVKRFPG